MSKTLKLRLTDNNIFDFEYFKYSDLIDNLEPQPGEIINVLEPFNLEYFETAYLEYNKYVVFKDALEDIITTRKLWSKEELKELLKYELNNPVLKWLMIRETREDKEIKEKLSLESFKLKDINKDNVILYSLINSSNQNKFIWACENGHLKVAQWLFSLGGINIHIYEEVAFRWACRNGHLEMAQWLYTLGDVNIHINDEEAFGWACQMGHLEVAQWLYSLGNVNIHINDEEAFRWACGYGNLEVAQWLFTLGDVNIHSEDENAFRWACCYGHLEVAQWLYSFGDVNIHVNNEYAFRWACEKGYLEVAQWIYNLGDVNIHILNDDGFVWACKQGHLEVAKWLYSLGGFNKDNIKTIHKHINDWFATLN